MGFFSNIAGAIITNALSSDPHKDLQAGFDATTALRGGIPLSAGGLSSSLGDNGFTIGSNPFRKRLTAQLALRNSRESRYLAGLAGSLKPGFGQITQTRTNAIENKRRAAISNLSDTLAQRRVLGSSFGQDAISRANAEFAQADSEARAKSFLEEFALTQALRERQFQRQRDYFSTHLNELNLQSEFGLKAQQLGLNALGTAAQIDAQLAGLSAEATGAQNEGLGGMIGTITDSIPF